MSYQESFFDRTDHAAQSLSGSSLGIALPSINAMPSSVKGADPRETQTALPADTELTSAVPPNPRGKAAVGSEISSGLVSDVASLLSLEVGSVGSRSSHRENGLSCSTSYAEGSPTLARIESPELVAEVEGEETSQIQRPNASGHSPDHDPHSAYRSGFCPDMHDGPSFCGELVRPNSQIGSRSDGAEPKGNQSDDSENPVDPLLFRRKKAVTRRLRRRSERRAGSAKPRRSGYFADVPDRLGTWRRKTNSRPSTKHASHKTTTSLGSTVDASSPSTIEVIERMPVQCTIKRSSIGEHDTFVLEFSAREVLAGLVDTQGPTAVVASPRLDSEESQGRARGRRARFSQREDDLLVGLKEQECPRLSWKDIGAHFPDRTVGALQVRYSTQLKGRRCS